jgi:hypothetical protein
LLAAWTDAPTFVWLLTEEILSEYVEVLERLRVRSSRRIVALIREQGQLVRILKKIPDLPDRDDAPFCECAESADADFIVTLNPSDFPQSRLKARVISPSDPLPAWQGAAAPPASRDPQEVAASECPGSARQYAPSSGAARSAPLLTPCRRRRRRTAGIALRLTRRNCSYPGSDSGACKTDARRSGPDRWSPPRSTFAPRSQ